MKLQICNHFVYTKSHTDFFNTVISLPSKSFSQILPSGSKDCDTQTEAVSSKTCDTQTEAVLSKTCKTQTEVSWLTRMKLKRQSTSPIDTTIPPEKLRIVSERQRYNDAKDVRYGSAGCGEFSRGVQNYIVA